MKSKVLAQSVGERVTVLGLERQTVRLLQAEGAGERMTVRHLAVRQLPEGETQAAARIVAELAAEIIRPAGRCLVVIPRSEVLVRYAKLPSKDPAEWSRLATYHLHGELPFPVAECVVAVQPVGGDDQGTTVLLAVAHRPVLDRAVALARSAGLTPEGVVISTEGAAQWAGRVWQRLAAAPPARWTFAAIAGETVELGIVAGETLVFMRQAEVAELTSERLAGLLQETVAAYAKDPSGDAPQQALVIGNVPAPAEWEQSLQGRLGIPVSVVNPATWPVWGDALTETALQWLHEMPLSDLLGVAVRPQTIALDLLPLEVKRERVDAACRRAWQRAAGWAVAGGLLLAGAAGAVVGRAWWQTRHLEVMVRSLEGPAAAVQREAAVVQAAVAAQQRTGAVLGWLTALAAQMPEGVTWNTVSVAADGRCGVAGTAPGYEAIFSMLSDLSGAPSVRDVGLRSATERRPGSVEFELVLQGVGP